MLFPLPASNGAMLPNDLELSLTITWSQKVSNAWLHWSVVGVNAVRLTFVVRRICDARNSAPFSPFRPVNFSQKQTVETNFGPWPSAFVPSPAAFTTAAVFQRRGLTRILENFSFDCFVW